MMYRNFLAALSLLLLCSHFGYSQNRDSLELAAYSQAKENVQLIKNDAFFIPIKNLEKEKIAFFSYLDDERLTNTLLQTIDKYDPVLIDDMKRGHLPNNINTKATTLIIAIEREKLPTLSVYLESLPQKEIAVVLAVFSKGGQDLSSLEQLPAKAVIAGINPTPLVADLMAQMIFGGIDIRFGNEEGHLPAIVRQYQEASIPTNATRLGYAPPAAVGLDGELLRDSIQAIVEEGIRAGAFPGAQVLVAKDGKVVYHRAFGYHTYDSIHPVQLTDLYDFASLSKVTTSLPILMKWYGEGTFDLDKTLGYYIPYFRHSNKADLTFREMLAHYARLMPWIPYWRSTIKGCAKYPWKKGWKPNNRNNGKFKRHTFKRDSSALYPIYVTDDMWLYKDYKKKMFKAIKKSPLREKKEYKYSGLLFYLLPDFIATKTHSDFETYLKNTIYRPLGATSLTYNPLRFYPKNRIIPTEIDTFFRLKALQGTVHDEGAAMMGGVSSNAGMFGAVNDVAKLFQMYLNGGKYGGEQIINGNAIAEFTRCQYCDEGNKRGLGFDKPLIEYDPQKSSVAKSASPASFGHSGYTGTFAWADPEHNLLFIFFSNRVYPTRYNRKIYTMNIRPRIQQAIYDAMKK